MKIKSAIQYFFSGSPKIHDKRHILVSPERIRFEFLSIKSFFFKHHQEGDKVGIFLDNDYRYLLSILACMDIGLTYIPLRIEWPHKRIKQIQDLTRFKTLITDQLMEEILSSKETLEDGTFSISDEKPLYCMFTSGSTGEPKGVVIQRQAYANFLEWLDLYFIQINSEDRLLNLTDFTFDVSLVDVGLTILKNLEYYPSNSDNDIFMMLGELDELKITVLATVPNNMNLILQDSLLSRANLSELKYLLIAGSKIPPKLNMIMAEKVPQTTVYNCYGPTEATIYCLVKKLTGRKDDVEDESVSIGIPILNVQALLVDESNNVIEGPFKRGELLVSGVQVMHSYINRPDLTDTVLTKINGKIYYKTGDVVFKNRKNEYFVVGRTDDTIKVSGQRINLSDIESYAMKLPYITHCSLIAIPDEHRENKLILFVTISETKDVAIIMQDLKKDLLRYQLPHEIFILESFPVNNSEKVDKLQLKALYLQDSNNAIS